MAASATAPKPHDEFSKSVSTTTATSFLARRTKTISCHSSGEFQPRHKEDTPVLGCGRFVPSRRLPLTDRQWPYVTPGTLQTKSSVDYKTRLGISGNLWRERLAYRYSIPHSRSTTTITIGTPPARRTTRQRNGYWPQLTLQPAQARITVTSFTARPEFHPVNALRIELGLCESL